MPEFAQLLHDPGLRRRWRWLLVVMMAATSWLAFMPSEPKPDALPHLDKLQHAAAFAALAAVAALAAADPRRAWPVGLSLLGYGLFVELVQAWLPTRHGDLLDLLADGAGILLGLALVRQSRRRWPPASSLG